MTSSAEPPTTPSKASNHDALRRTLGPAVVGKLEALDDIDRALQERDRAIGSSDEPLPGEPLYCEPSKTSLALGSTTWARWHASLDDADDHAALGDALGPDAVQHLELLQAADGQVRAATEAGFGEADVSYIDVMEEIETRAGSPDSADVPPHLAYWTAILAWKSALSALIPCVRTRWSRTR